MKIVADLHIHSHFSRATSKDMNIANLEKYGLMKGVNLIGCGDFTHPAWLAELKSVLKPVDDSGFFNYKDKNMLFALSAEISLIYSQDGKLRKIHNVLLAPSFEIVEQINEWLGKYGNLSADGRPVFGKITCPELVEAMMQISKDIMVIPAHAWTPWFSLFGSMSGFDSIDDCFQDQIKNIFAIETGLSSDPAMNWRLSQLDRFALVSNSDCHSYYPWRLGREANVFEIKPTYTELVNAIKNKDPKRFLFTIETDPKYGKYHWDGHRFCNVVMSPKEALARKNTCPVCGRQLTIGVEHRVEELADRPEGFVPKGAIPFKSLLPLSELIGGLYNMQPFSKKVFEIYSKLMKAFGNEFTVLLDVPEERLKAVVDEKIVTAIMRNRCGQIIVRPGYDGIYGVPVFEASEITEVQKSRSPQSTLDKYVKK
ncbi:MAG: endonuclease Q family protein [Candidatus Aenigmarchaeota archaeon]|nr:endonuclease Q family protein [Candidatus Aenigmarchaeota archaeon]